MKKIIKYLMFGFAVIVFVGYICYISGVFDKFSYDEVFEGVSDSIENWCHTGKFNEKSKFIPPNELTYKENGLIGVCEYIQLSEDWYGDYTLYDVHLASESDWDIDDCLNYKLKQECKQGKESESRTGYKYKIVKIVESAEYGEDKRGRGFCKKREVFKLKRGQPKETIWVDSPGETKCDMASH